MSDTIEKTEANETVPAVSKKRQFAASATSTGLTIALGILANVVIGKVAAKVQNRIVPTAENKTEIDN